MLHKSSLCDVFNSGSCSNQTWATQFRVIVCFVSLLVKHIRHGRVLPVGFEPTTYSSQKPSLQPLSPGSSVFPGGGPGSSRSRSQSRETGQGPGTKHPQRHARVHERHVRNTRRVCTNVRQACMRCARFVRIVCTAGAARTYKSHVHMHAGAYVTDASMHVRTCCAFGISPGVKASSGSARQHMRHPTTTLGCFCATRVTNVARRSHEAPLA